MNLPSPDCQLLLAFPAALEEMLSDCLLSSGVPLADLYLLPAATPAGLAPPLTAMERVRGKTERRLALLLLCQEQTPALLAALERAFPAGGIRWWSTPLLANGELRGTRP